MQKRRTAGRVLYSLDGWKRSECEAEWRMRCQVSGWRILGVSRACSIRGAVVAFSFPWRGFVDCCHQPGMKPIAQSRSRSHSSSSGTCRLTHKGRSIRCCLPASRRSVDESFVGEAAIANHERGKRCDQGNPPGGGRHGRWWQQGVLSFFFSLSTRPSSLAGRNNHDATARWPRIWTPVSARGVTLTSRCTRK